MRICCIVPSAICLTGRVLTFPYIVGACCWNVWLWWWDDTGLSPALADDEGALRKALDGKDAVLLLYAVNDPASFAALQSYWLPILESITIGAAERVRCLHCLVCARARVPFAYEKESCCKCVDTFVPARDRTSRCF